MSVLAFWVIAFMLTAYVVLDGYDLGVGAIAPLVARTDAERRAAMQSIGPFWNGNEVWLIAAGGALFALFPQAYASAFSGFYLPLMVMLWLLMGRGIAMELRDHFPSAIWHQFWDGMLSISSLLLIAVFGVALGNLIRGVPLDPQGYFNGTFAFLLNAYALLVAAFAIVALATHAAAFLAWRVAGPVGERARALGNVLWIACVALFVAVTIATFSVYSGFTILRWVGAVGAVAFIALIGARVFGAKHTPCAATATFIGALRGAAAGTIFPYVLPAYPAGSGGISVYEAAPSPAALTSALGVTIVGIVAVCIYSVVVWRKLSGKVT